MAGPTPNTLIDGRYRILSRLGAGGMADVFLAEDQQLSRKVALKLLHDRFAADPDFVERFRREAQAAAGLQHPNVVGIYDRGRYDDTYYIAMEYLPGRSLKQLIREKAPLAPVRAIDLTVQILRAARFAHRRGVIHRDLKPHNVIVDDSDQAKVTDFGIARAGASDMTETGSIMGTAQYLSPEQAQGHSVTAAADLYSVGVVLYELLTGRVPFEGDSPVTIALKHVSEAPAPPSQLNPAVPPELDQIVLWVLNKDPADRPADADQLIEALEHCRSVIASGRGQPTADMAAIPAAWAVGAAGAAGAGAGLAGRDSPGPPTQPEAQAAYVAGVATNGAAEYHTEPPEERERRAMRRWLWALLVLLLVAAAAAAAYLISKPKTRLVPSVLGEPVGLARSVLQKDSFVVDTIPTQSSRPVNTVIGEAPGPGGRADKGSTVTITVSAGPGRVSIPSVQGLSRGKALRTLHHAGLRTRVLTESSQQFSRGAAIGTDPRSGTSVTPGTIVTLLVSSGPPLKTVPTVTGEPQSAASSALQNAGFKVQVSNKVSTTVTAGNVISQSPAGNTSQAPGTTVTIVVASSPPTATVPPVVGDPVGSATSALQAAGFTVVSHAKRVTNPNQDGTVLSQSPSGGASAHKGSVVTITVGHYVPKPGSSSSSSSSSSTTPSSSSTSSTTPGGL